MLAHQDRRSAPRFKNRGFATAFGEVVDVSGSGVAVTHRGRKVAAGDELRLSISWNGRLVEVACVVRRTEPAGFRRQTVGLAWVHPPEGLEAWLRSGSGGGTECSGPRVYALPAA